MCCLYSDKMFHVEHCLCFRGNFFKVKQINMFVKLVIIHIFAASGKRAQLKLKGDAELNQLNLKGDTVLTLLLTLTRKCQNIVKYLIQIL